MKKLAYRVSRFIIIFMGVLFVVSGCAPFRPALYEKSLTGLDFSKYQKDGFFITTGEFNQSYKSLSILRATCYDGYMKKESPEDKKTDIWKNDDPLYSGTPSSFKKREYEFKSCKLSELLDYMVESGRKIGANGIIKLEIRPVTQTSPVNGKIQNGILVSGLAISY